MKINRNFGISLLFFAFLFIFNHSHAGDQKKVDNFALNDYKGKSHSLSDYRNAKAIVLVFVSTQCPVSNAYNDRMESIYKDFKEKNIEFLGINANKEETIEDIKQHAQSHNLTFTILKDLNNKIADRLGARVTPEAYVLNSNFEVLYHGRIDDSRNGDDIKSQDLRTALDEILSGKPISVEQTRAFGCSIKRVKGASE